MLIHIVESICIFIAGDDSTYAYGYFFPLQLRNINFADIFLEAAENLKPDFAGDNFGGEDGKLVSAKPHYHIAPAERAGESTGNGRQDFIADSVTVGVVDMLEVVNIKQAEQSLAPLLQQKIDIFFTAAAVA